MHSHKSACFLQILIAFTPQIRQRPSRGGDSRPSQAPKKRHRRTSMAKGRSVNEQCGFEVYKAAQNETHWLNEVTGVTGSDGLG